MPFWTKPYVCLNGSLILTTFLREIYANKTRSGKEHISSSIFRSLFYRSSPKVARARSSVHELYMRPYNYVSYKMGGSGGGSQYKYQYKTLHPQYGGYKPSPYQTPTPQPVTATPFYHSSPAYHTSAPYHAPTVATYQAPTYRYQPYSYPTTPSPTPQCILPPPTVSTCNDSLGSIPAILCLGTSLGRNQQS